MTLYQDVKRKCIICGQTSSHKKVRFNYPHGSDLDGRPRQVLMHRLEGWVETCPFCGFTSPDISESSSEGNYVLKEFLKGYLESADYKNNFGVESENEKAIRFLKAAILQYVMENVEKSSDAMRFAAYFFDEEDRDKRYAKAARIAAAELMKEVLAKREEELEEYITRFSNKSERMQVMMLDMLRRGERFVEVENLFKNLHFSNERLKKEAEFVLAKAREKDSARYERMDVDA